MVEDKNLHLKIWADGRDDPFNVNGSQAGFTLILAQAKAAAIDIQIQSEHQHGTSILATWHKGAHKSLRKI